MFYLGGKHIDVKFIKSVGMILLIFSCFVLCSCVKTEFQSNADTAANADNHSIIVDIPELGKEGQRVLFSKYCYIGSQQDKSQVLLVSDVGSDNAIEENTYLLVRTNNTVLSYDFGMCWQGTVADADVNIISANFDSDPQNELLVNFPINGNGATIAQILKVDDDSIELIQELNTEPASLYGNEEYKALFKCEFLENRKIRIYNQDIGFSQEADISYYSDDFFDFEGVSVSNTTHVSCGYIYDCFIEEYEKNTVLTCKCTVLLNTNYMGTMEMMYHFDENEKEFVLFDAEFILK